MLTFRVNLHKVKFTRSHFTPCLSRFRVRSYQGGPKTSEPASSQHEVTQEETSERLEQRPVNVEAHASTETTCSKFRRRIASPYSMCHMNTGLDDDEGYKGFGRDLCNVNEVLVITTPTSERSILQNDLSYKYIPRKVPLQKAVPSRVRGRILSQLSIQGR